MYIVGLNGSSNKNANVRLLLDRVLKGCEQLGAMVEVIDVPDAINSAKHPFCTVCSSPCNGSCYKDTLLDEAFEKMKKADAIVFGSPVYFGSVSGQLKAFFDKTRKLRAEKVFIGKPCGFIAVGSSSFGGQEATLMTMHSMALVQGMTILGTGHVDFDAGHLGVSARRPASEDENALSRCDSLAFRIMEEVK